MNTPAPLPSPYQPGGPIRTERQFIGRSDIIARAFSWLETTRHNVLVIEGRHRVGKTSLLHHLRRRWAVQDCSVVFSLEDFHTDAGIADVLHDVGRGIMRATPMLPYGMGRGGSSAEQSACQLIELLNQIARHRKAGSPFIVMLDDVSALASPQDHAPSTNALRYLEMITQRCPTTKFVIVQTYGPGAGNLPRAQLFQQAHRLIVDNLTRAEVAGVCRLSEQDGRPQGMRWTDEAIEAVFVLTDGHPLLVQAVCAGIWQRFTHAEPSHTAKRQDLEDEASLSLVLGETEAALTQIWAKLPVTAKAALIWVARQGEVAAAYGPDAPLNPPRRWHGALRQAYTELRHAGFLVAEGDGMRCSPRLLGLWAQRRTVSSDREFQQLITETDQLPQARTRTRSHARLNSPTSI
jgi:hypothetical protein